MTRLTVNDLARVVYSSGKVFDGLGTGRLDTERFLRSGVADAFNDALARAYVFDDDAAVQQMLHEHGLFARDGNGGR